MYILRSMFVLSGTSLYPGFVIERFDCNAVLDKTYKLIDQKTVMLYLIKFTS